MKIALLLRGTVSKENSPFHTKEEYLGRNGNYVNYIACYNSIKKHIIDFNKHCIFDTYIHCWANDLESELISLYKPKKYTFEDNMPYLEEITKKVINARDFSTISQALSQRKCIDLLDENYDLIILYRPDLLLWKDMDLNKYDPNKIYVNAHYNREGDFHFVMNMENILKFKYLYDSIEKYGIKPTPHIWMKEFILNHVTQNFHMDDIEPGLHQEVVRKINATSIKNWKIPVENFLKYGLTIEEIARYNSP